MGISNPTITFNSTRRIYRNSGYMTLSDSQMGLGGAASIGANTVTLTPFSPARNVSITNLYVWNTAGVSSANIKPLLYSSSAEGMPLGLVTVGSPVLVNAAGLVTIPFSIQLTSNTIYWIGLIADSSASAPTFLVANVGQDISTFNAPSTVNDFGGSGVPGGFFQANSYVSPTSINPASSYTLGNLPAIIAQYTA